MGNTRQSGDGPVSHSHVNSPEIEQRIDSEARCLFCLNFLTHSTLEMLW